MSTPLAKADQWPLAQELDPTPSRSGARPGPPRLKAAIEEPPAQRQAPAPIRNGDRHPHRRLCVRASRQTPGRLPRGADKALAKNPSDAVRCYSAWPIAFGQGESRCAVGARSPNRVQAGASIDRAARRHHGREGATNLSRTASTPPCPSATSSAGKDRQKMAGSAARVLDYSAVGWHPDARARCWSTISHYIQRIQSRRPRQGS